MTTENRLAKANGPKKGEKSPTDPHECCEWANRRLIAQGDYSREWCVTGNKDQPIALIRKT